MKTKQFKALVKYIITEISKANNKSINEMIGASQPVDYSNPRTISNLIYQPVYQTQFSHRDNDGSEVYQISLHSATGPKHAIKKDRKGNWFYLRAHDKKWVPANEYIEADKQRRSQSGQSTDQGGGVGYLKAGPLEEMIANKNVAPEPIGAVNVEEGPSGEIDMEVVKGYITGALRQFQNDKKQATRWLLGITGPKNQYSDEARMAIDMINKGQFVGGNPMEQSVSGGAGAYSTPFAFRKKVKEKIEGAVNKVKNLKSEKTLPDGRYADDMWDGGRMKRVEKMKESYDDEIHMTGLGRTASGGWKGKCKKCGNVQTFGQGVPPELAHCSKCNPFVLNIGWPLRLLGGAEGPSIEHLAKIAKDAGAEEFAIWSNDDDPNKRRMVAWYNSRTDGGKSRLQALLSKYPEAKRINEMTSSGAAGGQPGGTIQTPAWGTKNRLGSPRAISATKGLGYKVVKSITDEEQ